jgi:tetratricopeptide (TPR) repeat protein
MKNPKDSETAPSAVSAESSSNVDQSAEVKTKSRPVKTPKRWRVILVGLLVFLLFNLVGGGVGYAAGIQQRLAKESETLLVAAATHFNYGMQAQLQGNYEVARLQYEYVLKFAPDFPQIREKYTQVMIQIAKKNLPTPTPQATPTPDTSSQEAKFQQALQAIKNTDWLGAIRALEALRNQDLHYRALEVDGLYYIALRFGAIQMITQKNGDPEGALYYLTLASRFAPLDNDAKRYADCANGYSTAISWWGVDWEKVVYNLSLVGCPGVHDSSGNSTFSRQVEANWRLGDVKMAAGLPCKAQGYYQASVNLQPNNPDVQAKLTKAISLCTPPTAVVTAVVPTIPAPVSTSEPPTLPAPTSTPAPTPTS